MSPRPLALDLPVRARRALARPTVRRVAAGVLAVATALTVLALADAADAARDRWGRTRAVAVATRDLAPGELVEPGAAELRHLPTGLLAGEPLDEVPAGAVVRHPIVAGEPLQAGRLAPHGVTGVAALLGRGERAVAVPAGAQPTPPLAVGDRVDVLAVLPAPDLDVAGGRRRSRWSRATVVDVGDDAVTVAVPRGRRPVAWARPAGGRAGADRVVSASAAEADGQQQQDHHAEDQPVQHERRTTACG